MLSNVSRSLTFLHSNVKTLLSNPRLRDRDSKQTTGNQKLKFTWVFHDLGSGEVTEALLTVDIFLLSMALR